MDQETIKILKESVSDLSTCVAGLNNRIIAMQTTNGKLEEKLDSVVENTRGAVEAFNALAGAMKVFETIGKISKPVFWLASIIIAITTMWHYFVDVVKVLFHKV